MTGISSGRPLGRAALAMALIAMLCCLCLRNSFCSIDGGTLIYESPSPGGTRTARFYRITGAFTPNRVRVEVVFSDTGRSRDVLLASTDDLTGRLSYDKDTWITWVNDDVAVIFGHELDVRTESYHYKRR